MVWLNRSPIPVRGGGNLLVQMISTFRHGLRGRGEEVGTLMIVAHFFISFVRIMAQRHGIQIPDIGIENAPEVKRS